MSYSIGPLKNYNSVKTANKDYNKLLLILSWDDNGKGKQKEIKLIWNTDQIWEIDNNQNELTWE
ncbi:hypothetical protein G9A89_008586 [Geosiphon pyriformis]|nr:hypothetical protein G9A89_008586 [Geosiphon pyriformis]